MKPRYDSMYGNNDDNDYIKDASHEKHYWRGYEDAIYERSREMCDDEMGQKEATLKHREKELAKEQARLLNAQEELEEEKKKLDDEKWNISNERLALEEEKKALATERARIDHENFEHSELRELMS